MKKKNTSKELKKNIPNEIKVEFGKFFIFSIILFIFLGIIYPLVIVKYCSIYTKIGVLVFSILFYGYMVFMLFKKKKSFMSLFVPISIIIFILLVGFAIFCLFDI